MKVQVGILGATGLLGQHYMSLLRNHPWFEVTFIGGSRSCLYEEAVEGRWHLQEPMPEGYVVSHIDDIKAAREKCAFVFSALPTDLAGIYDEKYAAAGIPVLSNASLHRPIEDIPVLIAEVNAHHLEVIKQQQKNRGWDRGFIVTKPNCAIQAFTLPLAPLEKHFGLAKLHITTLQAISGAGLSGLSSLSIHDNVIPFIAGEEEKIETEPLKIFGSLDFGKIKPHESMIIASHVNRVPVLNGHLACISVSFLSKPSREEILEAWSSFKPLNLPSAPQQPIVYRDEPARPQTRLDRDVNFGMSVVVGRLRPCPLLDFRFVGLSNNAVRGGAGGGVLNAELMLEKGILPHGPA